MARSAIEAAVDKIAETGPEGLHELLDRARHIIENSDNQTTIANAKEIIVEAQKYLEGEKPMPKVKKETQQELAAYGARKIYDENLN